MYWSKCRRRRRKMDTASKSFDAVSPNSFQLVRPCSLRLGRIHAHEVTCHDRRVTAVGYTSQKLPSTLQRNIETSRRFFLEHSQQCYRSVVLDWTNEVRRLNFFDDSEPVLENISCCQPASNRMTDSLQHSLCGLDTMVLSLFKNRNAT